MDIKGLGEKRITALNGAGIFSPIDLLNHFPKKYYDFSRTEEYIEDGAYRLIFVKLIGIPKVFNAKRFKVLTIKAQTPLGKEITLYFYGQTFLKNSLTQGQYIYAYGKNSPKKKNAFVVTMHKTTNNVIKGILAVYKTMENIGQETLKNAINKALEGENIVSFIPKAIEEQHGVLPLYSAYYKIHLPETQEDVESGADRIALENALIFAHINNKRKVYLKTKRNFSYSGIEETKKEFESLIPFKLTSSQNEAINAIIGDFRSQTVCNRLIEGDTGCGKTMVAYFAMLLAKNNGFQSAMMAPTEILARQHYNGAVSIFGSDGIAFIASSTPAKEKQDIYAKLKKGQIKMLFGTHALFSQGVEFNNLKLAIVDEQHKFGVAERANLAGKNECLDYISLSATPIPRSVSLVLYGGLDITQMKVKPHTADIQTNLVSSFKAEDMWSFVKDKLNAGETAYVVCPKIDDDEEKDSLFSTQKVVKMLKEKFGDVVCELNGKMKDEAKNEIIEKFKSGTIKLLVSTSVIEVGVDSKTASIMIVLNPERFGLASLHQLRGRVGRMGQKSYCFCLLSENINEKQFERLSFFKNNSSGLDIADYDLKTRGAGDAFGTRQHGEKSVFNISLSIYNKAQQIYEQMLNEGADLSKLDMACENNYTALLKNIILN